MKLQIKLFAVAKQRLGRGAIELELPGAVSVRQLRGAIVEQFPQLADVVRHARIAVDNEYAADDAAIGMQSELAIIPPVSGG
jgi:molybdopterin converting factor small subunit